MPATTHAESSPSQSDLTLGSSCAMCTSRAIDQSINLSIRLLHARLLQTFSLIQPTDHTSRYKVSFPYFFKSSFLFSFLLFFLNHILSQNLINQLTIQFKPFGNQLQSTFKTSSPLIFTSNQTTSNHINQNGPILFRQHLRCRPQPRRSCQCCSIDRSWITI